MEHIPLLGKLYDFEYTSEDQQKLVYFQGILDVFDSQENTKLFNPYERLRSV